MRERLFRKTRHTRAFEDVADQIEEAILSRKFCSGDKLPPERKLLELFGTSRGTLREALRVLEQKGLVEIRIGVKGGVFVKKVSTAPMCESLARLIRYKHISLKQFCEFRKDVEGSAAYLAAKRASRREIDNLVALLMAARKHVAMGADHWHQFYEVERSMHITLVRAANNPLYEWVVFTIHANAELYYKILPKNDENLVEAYEDWEYLIGALKRKDCLGVKQLMEDHITRFNRYLVEGESVAGEKEFDFQEAAMDMIDVD